MDGPKSEAEAVEAAKPPNGEELRKQGQTWVERIEAAQKREKYWLDEAAKATLAYTGEEGDTGESQRLTFNILHSNVETIVPAIYNSTPAPDVRRRFRDDDEAAKTASQIIERATSVQLDNGALDDEIEAHAQDAYIAGRGVLRTRLEVDGDEDQPETQFQRITFEAVPWRDYVEGPAKRWRDVPWVAFRITLTKESSDGIADAAYLAAQTKEGEYKFEGEARDDVEVWEVWCKKTQTVYFVRASDGVLLKEQEDPLGLSTFFPVAKPCQPIEINGRRMPVNPYSIYRELAIELDTLTKRIKGIAKGIKVRGATISGELATDIEKWAEAGDNEIIAVRSAEAFVQAGGLDKAIAWWPIEQAVNVLRELVAQREQTKQAIYEITGISDIVRGASKSDETATAQQIKTQWGSLRIKKMQRGIEATVREVFNMMAELICTKFTPETLTKITGIQVTPEVEAILNQPIQRMYRIDVESDSTVRGDVSRAQGEMQSFLQGTAQYIQAIGPAVQQGQMSAEVALEIYSSFARTFKLGKQAEDAIDQLAEQARQKKAQEEASPQPEKPDPATLEVERKTAADRASMQFDQAKMQSAHMLEQARMEIDRGKLELEAQRLAADTGIRRAQLMIEAMRADEDAEAKKHAMAASDREAGLIETEGEDGETQKIGLPEALNSLGQMIAQMVATSQQRDERMMGILTAPKEVMRDQEGRAVGVRHVMPEPEPPAMEAIEPMPEQMAEPQPEPMTYGA